MIKFINILHVSELFLFSTQCEKVAASPQRTFKTRIRHLGLEPNDFPAQSTSRYVPTNSK